MARLGKLTARQVATLPPRAAPYGDGGGLYLQVRGEDSRSWLFRFTLRARSREMGLGPVHDVGLAEAREKARECRRLARDGIDPIEARKVQRLQQALEAGKAVTFRAAAGQYIEAHSAAWKNARQVGLWSSTLETYAFPIMGPLAVASIDVGHVLAVLKPIWTEKSATASRVRGRIESILDWARVMKLREGENPARWRGHLDRLLPARSKVARVRHHPALAHAQIPQFMADLRQCQGAAARALEFAILTAARVGAVIGATGSEIDLAEKVWTVAPGRVGAKISGEESKPRRVPLSARAIEILKDLPAAGPDDLVFRNEDGRALSDRALRRLLLTLRSGLTVHGFRSTFKDWCAETTRYPNEVSEAALWHSVADKVEAAYRRTDLLELRRALMRDWADFCAGVGKSGRVIPISRRARK